MVPRRSTLPSLCLIPILGACTTTTPPAPVPWVDLSEQASIVGFETEFRGQAPFDLTETEQTQLRRACPRIDKAQLQKDSARFYLLSLLGERLDVPLKVAAHLPDGSFADADSRYEDDRLRVPVACQSCTVFLSVPLEGARRAACTGPGYSLTIQDGRLILP